MTLDILPEAQAELQDSALYFDSLRPSKYDEFMAEWNHGVHAIQANPYQYPPDEDAPDGLDVRTYLFPRFQRRIIYQLRDERIAIVALAHTRKQPGYWHNRIE